MPTNGQPAGTSGGTHIPVGGSTPATPSAPPGFAPTGAAAPGNPGVPPGLPPIAITAGRPR
jgi:hypothetical protein